MNTFHYKSTQDTADAATAFQDWLDAFEEGVVVPIQQCQSNAVEQCYMQIQKIHPDRFQPIRRPCANLTGAEAFSVTGSGEAMVVRRKGDQSNKHSQGRIYVPGLPRDFWEMSLLTDAFFDAHEPALKAAMTLVLNDGVGDIGTPIIYQAGSGIINIIVTSAQVDRVARYQRRREVGVGI